MMRQRLAFSLVVLFAIAVNGFAQSNRTFVSSTGLDTNPCSLTSPCRSLGVAIAVTNAGGEVIILNSAGYGNNITIDKALSIIAPNGVYGGMTPGAGTAISVNAPGATVTLRGLFLNSVGATYGVRAVAVGTLNIENMVVTNFSSDAIFAGGTAGTPTWLTVKDSIVRGNGYGIGGGIVVQGADAAGTVYATIDNTRIERNGSAIGAVNDAGLAALDFSKVTANRVVAAGNFRGFSVSAFTNPCQMTVENSVASDNTVGLFATDQQAAGLGPTALMRVSNSVVTHNTLFGIESQNGGITSRGNNTVIDNAGGEVFTGPFVAK